MKKIFVTMMAGTLLMFSSCSKQGAEGPQGPAGIDGNANVIGESPVTVSSWAYGSNVYSATFTDGNITSDVVNNGIVEVYKQYSDGSWTNLPDINGITSTVYNFYTGGFVISILNSDGTAPAAPGTITFRVVVVPSSVRKANPNTNWTNYAEVVKLAGSAAVKTAVMTR
jgi:hypothetical protein